MNDKQQLFTNQQIEQANQVNLIAYARSRGHEVKRISNNSYKLPGYGGLFISGDGAKWNWFSQNKGGGSIQFVMEMENKSWVDSVKELLGIDHNENPVVQKKVMSQPIEDMVLPDKNDTYKHIFAYLIKSRMIDSDIVTDFVNKKLIYEDSRRNCVFVGYNSSGEAAYGSMRSSRTTGEPFKGDVKNSDKSVPFYYEGKSDTVCVFESPIDMMSYLNLLKLHGCNDFEHHMISLGGVSDRALLGFLDNSPGIETIVLCLDNDEAGQNGCLRIGIKLQNEYQLRRHSPRSKDFNEDLVLLKEELAQDVRDPPEISNEGEEIG